jgi:hypothetical protein
MCDVLDYQYTTLERQTNIEEYFGLDENEIEIINSIRNNLK